MRKRELLKRIEELEKAVAILQQKVASIENKPIAPIQINPWIKENPPYTYPNITCWDNSTDGHSFARN
jgi:hypothetical protein